MHEFFSTSIPRGQIIFFASDRLLFGFLQVACL
jgi:hypothetical protein